MCARVSEVIILDFLLVDDALSRCSVVLVFLGAFLALRCDNVEIGGDIGAF